MHQPHLRRTCKDVDTPRLINASTRLIITIRRPDRPIAFEGSPWGYYIRRERHTRRLSMPQTTKLIGCCEESISGWELYGREPEHHKIPGIIKFLGFVPLECSPYQPSLGASIKAARELSGLTQKQLAKKCRLSPATIASAERNGPTRPANITRIGRALGVPFSRYMQPGGWLNPA